MEDLWDDSEGIEMEEQVIILIRSSAVELRDNVIHFTGSTKSGGPTGWEDFSMFWWQQPDSLKAFLAWCIGEDESVWRFIVGTFIFSFTLKTPNFLKYNESARIRFRTIDWAFHR
jgi:hypothetical protein